jgi:pimeloyl-ACP methyl ester carboxylesterase
VCNCNRNLERHLIESRSVQSRDGTELAVYEAGDPDGLPIVLCNGLGGGVLVWREVLRRLGPGLRTVAWDYRGTYRSSPAAGSSGYRLERHVDDLLCVLDATRCTAPVLAGWSMGVQVMLELQRVAPQRARGLVFVHGAPGTPLRTAFDSAWSATLAPTALQALRLVGRRLNGPGPQLARSAWVSGGFVWLGQQLGVMAPSLDVAFFREVAEEWTGLDLAVYAELFAELDQHDATDLLTTVPAPTLVIAGGRDRFTPAHLSRRMADSVSNSQLYEIPHATHFGLLEAPAAIARRIRRFLEESVGLAVGAGAPASPRNPVLSS